MLLPPPQLPPLQHHLIPLPPPPLLPRGPSLLQSLLAPPTRLSETFDWGGRIQLTKTNKIRLLCTASVHRNDELDDDT